MENKREREKEKKIGKRYPPQKTAVHFVRLTANGCQMRQSAAPPFTSFVYLPWAPGALTVYTGSHSTNNEAKKQPPSRGRVGKCLPDSPVMASRCGPHSRFFSLFILLCFQCHPASRFLLGERERERERDTDICRVHLP